jgi:hypothetical protein
LTKKPQRPSWLQSWLPSWTLGIYMLSRKIIRKISRKPFQKEWLKHAYRSVSLVSRLGLLEHLQWYPNQKIVIQLLR